MPSRVRSGVAGSYPDTSQADRIARGAGVQLVDHRERRNYEEALAPYPPRLRAGAKRAADREQELRDALARLGISSIAPPSATELFRRFAVPDEQVPGEGKALFHLLCGYAHNHQWILATTAMTEGTALPAADARLVQVSARMNVPASFAVASRNVLSVALSELERYAGRAQ